mgnify:CR=1 FL=1
MWIPQILDKTSSYDDLVTGKIPALIIPGFYQKLIVLLHVVKY